MKTQTHTINPKNYMPEYYINEESYNKTIEEAKKDYLHNIYPDHDVMDHRILVARPDAWIVFKLMALEMGTCKYVYFCEIRNNGKKDVYKIVKGEKALLNEVKKLQN